MQNKGYHYGNGVKIMVAACDKMAKCERTKKLVVLKV